MSSEPEMRRVTIFDTTLRDGEQSPGASMNLPEKLEVAQALVDLGVDVIEAGFAAASPGDFDAVSKVAAAVETPVVLSLSRTREADIDRALEAVEGAKPSRARSIRAFTPSSPRPSCTWSRSSE